MIVHGINPGLSRPVPNQSILPDNDDPNHSCKHQFVRKQNYRSCLMIVHKMKLKLLKRYTIKHNHSFDK
jgi:hypothetical protein